MYSRTQVSVYEAVRVPVSGLLLLGSLPKECVDGVRYAVLPHRLILRIFSFLHFFRDSNGGECITMVQSIATSPDSSYFFLYCIFFLFSQFEWWRVNKKSFIMDE